MTEEFNDEKQGLSNWLADNLRIIISIFIVVLVAGSIYSYSKRSEERVVATDQNQEITEEEMLAEILGENQEATEEETLENTEEAIVEDAQEEPQIETEEAVDESEVAVSEPKEVVAEDTEEEIEQAPAEEEQEIIATQDINQETEGSFIEVAIAGEGTTHLARKALNDYLEKNPDSSLSPEHKVYIEDYLRKKIGFQDSVHIGTSIEFSKSLIKEAIDASKSLNDAQLRNLQKYTVAIS
ncbi:MAG: hypothetical protein OEV93_04460 [Candidatus Moranbacteria bacterium]|nr:hypothetical protein [Candidatus Moranbacteria bacterium]